MKNLLLVIDVQKDFVNDNTKDCVSKIESLVNSNKFDMVAFTKYINDEDSNFYKDLKYKGCMTEEGRKIVVDTRNNKVFEKRVYTAVNEELKKYFDDNKIDNVYLCGIDTDACVLKTALDLFESNINVFVLKDYCMSHSGEIFHDNAILMLEKLIGKNSII